MKRFLVQLSILAIGMAIGIAAWNEYGPPQRHLNSLWLILIFFIGVTALVHNILLRSNEKNPKQFIRNFMGTTAAKLFAYLLIMIVYIFVDRAGARVFLVGFLVHYLVFTVFEVVSILRQLKK